jgi:hypothetical protein
MQALCILAYAIRLFVLIQTKHKQPMTTAEYQKYKLGANIANATETKEKSERVLDILTRHPEFHEFIEVLRSGLI